MSDLYWLAQSLLATPLAIWIIAGVGLPWALAYVPRRLWRQRALVACLALVFGPMLVSAWMLALGTVGMATQTPLYRFDLAFGGTVALALAGGLLAWGKRRRVHDEPASQVVLNWDERLLVALIALAWLVRWVVTAYWPFTAYDALWVYGFQPRLYLLTGWIPETIGYYPQFLQQQFLFLQLGAGGIDDHAARAIVPFLHGASILSAYLLGSRLFSRRVGIFAAAMWALYPHVGSWAHIGDLEIPQTFLFTTSAAFFLMAWHEPQRAHRRWLAITAGLVFGVTMWTKPTAGAFIWGVLLMVVLAGLLARGRWERFWPRFEVAFWTGLACIPLGSVWYMRNIILGHPPITLPHVSWLGRATRSGDLFGWVLLALAFALFFVIVRRGRGALSWQMGLGLLLLCAGVAPSLPWLNPARSDPPASYIQPLEWLALGAGLALLGLVVWRAAWQSASTQARQWAGRMSWAYILAGPYFITWFISYSYHYRLSFAIVPLLILPSAAVLARLVPGERVAGWAASRHRLWGIMLCVCALPGIVAPITTTAPQMDYLWVDHYPDDWARYKVHNPGIVLVAEYLQGYIEAYGTSPRIIAPGEQRLPFFFPLMPFDAVSLPTRLDELAGATHYLYGSHARWRYEDESIPINQNQVVAALGRDDIFERYFIFADGTFRYELYEIKLAERWRVATDLPLGNPEERDVRFGDFVRYLGHSASNDVFATWNAVYVDFYFQALGPAPEDYRMQIALLDPETGEELANFDEWPLPSPHGHYHTTLWQVDEVIRISRRLQLTADMPQVRSGPLELAVGFYRGTDAGRTFAPVTIEGVPAGRYTLDENFRASQ